MFAYGVCVGPSAKFTGVCEPALQRFASGPILTRRSQTSIFSAYNSILTEAGNLPGLEGVVLMHDDVELLEEVETELRACFQDPAVAVVGVIGARTPSFAWWDGARFGSTSDSAFDYRYSQGRHDVDTVDGMFLALSPWAVRNLQFDAHRFNGFHGYDRDLCSQVRSRGLRVIVADLALKHHSQPSDLGVRYERARLQWQVKWSTGAPRISSWLRLVTLGARTHRHTHQVHTALGRLRKARP